MNILHLKHQVNQFNLIFMIITSFLHLILRKLDQTNTFQKLAQQIFQINHSTTSKNVNKSFKNQKLLHSQADEHKQYPLANSKACRTSQESTKHSLFANRNYKNQFISIIIKLKKCREKIKNIKNKIGRLQIFFPQRMGLTTTMKLILLALLLISTSSSSGSVPNCASYSLDGVSCIDCDSGYHLDDPSSCGSCIDSYCSACTLSGAVNTCTSCISGYYVPPGYFYCATSSISNCNVFDSTSSICLTCNAGYILSSGGASCSMCSNFMLQCLTCTTSSVCTGCSAGYIIDVSHHCSLCAILIPGCTSCDSLSVCKACHTDTYFLPSNDTICYLCSQKISNCSICDYLGNSCTTCDPNYMLASSQFGSIICLPCEAVVPNCTACGSSVCTSCISNYVVIANNTCQPCSSLIANCTSCSTSTNCLSCIPNTIVVPQAMGVTDCEPCGVLIAGCLQCTTYFSCDLCAAGYYPSLGTMHMCYTCSSTLAFCMTCTSSTTCTSCSSVVYAINATSQCESCSLVVPGCLTCLNSSYCLSCISDAYYLDATLHVCLPCYFLFPGCTQCSQTACLLCGSGFHLNTKLQCQCNVGYLINGFCINVFGCNSTVTIPYIQPICNGCSNNLILINNGCFCPDGERLVTGICTNITGCIAINPNNPSKSCIFCNVSQLMVLNSKGTCECKPYFYMADSGCLQICGDGKLFVLPCDDGNTISGDGCSSTCQLQSGYTCTVVNQISECVYDGKFIINLVAVQKIPNVNSGEFIFQFTPKNANLAKINFTKSLHLSIPNINITITSSYYSNGLLIVNFDYGSSISGQMLNLLINFDSSLFGIGNTSLSFPIDVTGLSLTYMNRQYLYKMFGQIFLGLGFLALGIFFISLPLHKMIGVETIQVFQIFFMILLIMENYEQPYNELKYLQNVMGYFFIKTYSPQIAIFTPNFYNRLGVVKDYAINQLIVAPVTFILGIIFLIFLGSYLMQKSKREQDQIQKPQKQTTPIFSYVYRFLLFPIVIGFSFSSFLALHAQLINPGQWISQSNKNQVFAPTLLNVSFIFPFCLSYPMIVAAEMIFSSAKLSNSFANLQRANSYYVIVYLAYSFTLFTAFLIGYQISNQMALYLITAVIVIYTVAIFKSRPYHNWIHNASICINQIALMVLVITLLHRRIAITSNQPFDESDNFLVILFYLSILILVQLLALIRIFFQLKRIIIKCCKKRQKSLQNSITKQKPDLHELILDKSNEIMKQSHPQGNSYRFINQLLERKRQDWEWQNKIREQKGMITFQFDDQRVLKSQFFIKQKKILTQNKMKVSLLNHMNSQGDLEDIKQHEFAQLKQKMCENILNFKIDQ